MISIESRFKSVVATFAVLLLTSASAMAQTAKLDELFDQLREPDLKDWQQVEDQIWSEWTKSGSAAIDLLLERGHTALAMGDAQAAVEHFTALTDHAPEFAEGYNARATAFYQAGRYGLALRDIKIALALNPRHFSALSGLALILEDLDHPEEALSAYRAAHAIHPHLPDVRQAIERLEDEMDGSDI